MTEEIEEYNHNQIIKWLEKRLGHEGIYKDLEESPEFQADVKKAKEKQKFHIYPRLYIDLIRVEERLEPIDQSQTEKANGKKEQLRNYYTLFFAVSSKIVFKDKKDKIDDFTDTFKERLSFYQFYLSRISEPQRVEIIIIVPYYIDVPGDCLDFCEETGFGLWQVDIGKEKEDVVCQPKSLRNRMIKELEASIDDPEAVGEAVEKIAKKMEFKDVSTFKEAIKEEAKDFELPFEKYILEAVDAIAGVTPDIFGERYIDRTLLNLMCELKNISYGERLRKLVNEQLDENLNDYQFVSEVFNVLWEENIGVPYSKFLETFEPALLHVFAEGEERREKIYRDHYIHQFQVFMLGTYIIDKLYDDFIKNGKLKNPEISWLIAASFHDMAWPVQLYDDWSEDFFKKVFSLDIKLAHLELKSSFVDQSFLSCMGYLISSLYWFHKKVKLEGNWLADKDTKELVQFFYKEITGKKNHCILSSISLLKMVQDFNFNEKNMIKQRILNNKGQFIEIVEEVFVPSALAIALHDKKVWQELRKEDDEDNPPRILNNMEFEKDPLSFLLIFCDNIQEWGRPSKSHREKESERGVKFYLQAIECDPKTGLDITIRTPNYTKSEQFFKNKQDELREIQFFLKQPPGRKFAIRLEDKNNEGEDFEMRG